MESKLMKETLENQDTKRESVEDILGLPCAFKEEPGTDAFGKKPLWSIARNRRFCCETNHNLKCVSRVHASLVNEFKLFFCV